MTSLTTIFGLICMAIDGGADGAIFQPMAITAIGGLFFSTMMTLFVVPLAVDIVYRNRDVKTSAIAKEETI
jgi:HAE1 family hydrophobic/amphiphilic exporter-1